MSPYWCVVPAAGVGRRVGGSRPKQYLPLAGRPLILHTLDRLAAHPHITGLMLVLAAQDQYWSDIHMTFDKPVRTTTGGGERADSVLAGLEALSSDVDANDFVLVHDAARPCVRLTDMDQLIERVSEVEGGLLGAPLRDTLKYVSESESLVRTESRSGRWRAFTPQMFRYGALRNALRSARDCGLMVSDEAMAMELAGHVPVLVEGAEDNIKVTTRGDFELAELLLARTR